MDVKKIMPFLIPTRGRISQLVSDILTLEQKLENVDHQSEYFRMALDSHLNRHVELLDQYDVIRREFNETTLDELVRAVKENKMYLRHKAGLRPLIARSIVQHVSLARVARTTEFITLKSFTDVLPEFDVLRSDAEILRDILP